VFKKKKGARHTTENRRSAHRRSSNHYPGNNCGGDYGHQSGLNGTIHRGSKEEVEGGPAFNKGALFRTLNALGVLVCKGATIKWRGGGGNAVEGEKKPR